MRRFWVVAALSLVGLLFAFSLGAQEVSMKTGDTRIEVSGQGNYTSIQVCGEEILAGEYPILTAGTEGRLVTPVSLRKSGNQLRLTMADGGKITLRYRESDACVRLEATSVPERYDLIIFGPFGVTIDEVVGDVIGVAQGGDVAFGVQALNMKTTVGIPRDYVEATRQVFAYEGEPTVLSVSTLSYDQQAATRTDRGTIFQFTARRRDREEYRPVQRVERSLVLPVKGEDGPIRGAAIGLFGCRRAEALARIGAIEVAEGLPHPMLKGEWAKLSRESMKSYLISNFTEKNLDAVLEKARIAGFDYIYHEGPFEDWGHFNWDTAFVTGGDAGVRRMVDKAAAMGIGMGLHTLSNFTTTNDAYVTPVPSEHLLSQGVLTLLAPLDERQTEIRVWKSDLFAVPLTLNGLRVGEELIAFGKTEERGDTLLLTDCERGAWGTTAAAHAATDPVYKLWDYPYKTFFPDLELQDVYADRLADLFNKTGLCQISFDGLEGCAYTGHDDYAMARFVDRFFRQVDHPLRNDASRLTHYLWHVHTYTNWGEPWGEAMRTGQVDSRIKNQAFYHRNLFPRMLGWFLIRLADRRQECTSLEDLEWAMSEAAGFDAGYGMTIRSNTLRRHGQIDRLLEAIRDWDYLRERQAFTEEQRARLRDPKTEWHLERQADDRFLLYPLHISKTYTCNLGEMQPGQPGGADWSWETPYGGAYAIRLRVDGDGTIRNPRFTTPEGVILFPCEISDRQYLLYTFDGKAVVTDKNYNVIREVRPEGEARIPEGTTAVSFSCELVSEDAPDVLIRHITRDTPEEIRVVKE